nr:MAG TPA: hypothetical protein [Caudoviricetes sp.]DAU59307.1 MAG TPA: hypothetical protein [Crassvirales sp.]
MSLSKLLVSPYVGLYKDCSSSVFLTNLLNCGLRSAVLEDIVDFKIKSHFKF